MVNEKALKGYICNVLNIGNGNGEKRDTCSEGIERQNPKQSEQVKSPRVNTLTDSMSLEKCLQSLVPNSKCMQVVCLILRLCIYASTMKQ